MKTFALPVVVVFITAFAVILSFSGCGSSNAGNSTNTVFSGLCTGTGCGTAGTFTGGDTETFNIASTYALSEYAGMTITQATGVTVNINLNEISTSPQVFLGQMQIEYTDQNGALHLGTFVNGTSITTWNKFSNNVSTLVGSTYRIFFEDPAGAIILLINAPSGTDTVITGTGQIWFSNFNAAGAPNPLYQGAYDEDGNYYPPGYVFCWMVSEGPYDCRNFNVPPSSVYHDSAGGGVNVPAFGLLGNIPTVNINSALGL